MRSYQLMECTLTGRGHPVCPLGHLTSFASFASTHAPDGRGYENIQMCSGCSTGRPADDPAKFDERYQEWLLSESVSAGAGLMASISPSGVRSGTLFFCGVVVPVADVRAVADMPLPDLGPAACVHTPPDYAMAGAITLARKAVASYDRILAAMQGCPVPMTPPEEIYTC